MKSLYPSASSSNSGVLRVASPALQSLLGLLAKGSNQRLTVSGLTTGVKTSATALAIAGLLERFSEPLLILTPTEEASEQLYRDLQLFLPRSERLLLYPTWDVGPYEGPTPHAELSTTRAQVLARLAEGLPVGLVAPVEALLKRVVPRSVLRQWSLELDVGAEYARETLVGQLFATGYQRAESAEVPGLFASRGDLLDVFLPGQPAPYRLSFFGDELESIQLLEAGRRGGSGGPRRLKVPPLREEVLGDESLRLATQRLKSLSDALEKPAHIRRQLLDEMTQKIFFPGLEYYLSCLHPALADLTEYLPPGARVLWLEPVRCMAQLSTYHARLIQHATLKDRKDVLLPPPEELFLTPEALQEALARFVQVSVTDALDPVPNTVPSTVPSKVPNTVPSKVQAKVEPTRGLRQSLQSSVTSGSMSSGGGSSPGTGEGGLLTPLVDRLRAWHDEQVAVYVVCRTPIQVNRLKELLTPYRVSLAETLPEFSVRTLLNPFSDARHLLRPVLGELSEGFRFPEGRLVLLSEEDLFGPKVRTATLQTKRLKAAISSFSQLRRGDLVVHRLHGIGRFKGLTRLELAGVEGDFLQLEYSGGDKLYVPAHRVQGLSKYTGQGEAPKLDKLGGLTFSKTRAKVSESLLKVAHQLLELYAARAVLKGHTFKLDRRAIDAFEVTFPYEETPDQLAAIEAVYSDMASDRPMDRLVCGDVGYGKTEVAIRAAFMAVMDSRQVAVLVPTTVLALQHFRSFQARFADWPVQVEMLNRFRTAKEQRETLERLKQGKVDILIGTHRLLSADVTFKNLGLLVVDEEHRFGVSHKEKIKRLKKGLDVLTMTATPIPRTLHMAMSGLRDFSLITTPPQDRQAIRTWQVEFNVEQIREAIELELEREGQVYFVHNRVQSIQAMGALLHKLVPSARIGVAHGQMGEGELEEVMMEFIDKKIDILCCTSIIESGLDIPQANTIFINRADRFGLAQLYQLRGRVGRSSAKASCYLLTPPNLLLPDDATRRLRTLCSLTELGAGFRVASEDLEMRGAGDLLGSSQSGSINAVGFDLYCELLERAVQSLQGQVIEEEIEPEIDLKLPAFFPDAYIPDIPSRLQAYKMLADASDDAMLEARLEELSDRFGPYPVPVRNLQTLMRIRLLVRPMRVKVLTLSGFKLVIHFDASSPLNRKRLVELVTKQPKRYFLTQDQRLSVVLTEEEQRDPERCVKNLLQTIR